MLFSSLIFLWLALPLIWGGSWLLPRRWLNAFLLVVSLLVYAWGGVSYSTLLLGSIGMNYLLGRQLRGSKKKFWLALGVVLNLLLLGIFKYAAFATTEFNRLWTWFGEAPLPVPDLTLPLGISFYTFQAISYLVDTYRGVTPPQRRLDHLGLYIAFFPQLIAGPIVRYQDIREQILQRVRSWEKTHEGIRRFLVGLAKKVLIANTLAGINEEIFALDFTTMDPLTAWVGIVSYAGQIYYDFSGYSDMAIGLGLLFGFRLPENFNFPYASRSIREFWRRWHITLGAWFRDYLYIPLGGSRGSNWATSRNLLLVFMATGIWHGAAWSFLLWGLWHGLFIALERQRWWPLRGVLYAFLVTLFGWVLFRTESFTLSVQYYAAMFGLNGETIPFDWSFYWNRELSVVSVVTLLGFWPWWRPMTDRWGEILARRPWLKESLLTGALLVLFLLCTNSLVNNNLNPFIYFRF
ncbi:MBOAT family protein [Lewinella sp. W8]|uniref:MBOAT family O-acyltransferase n=1 Tax=Lewinella sp. W8 TaxID=2528208 RepID=UPI001067EC95|nr:MBOAT family O-acyltransferase [Lewinella sp. W8]MTB51449.1 MBOAT family protein [Lewinella sp. W8]